MVVACVYDVKAQAENTLTVCRPQLTVGKKLVVALRLHQTNKTKRTVMETTDLIEPGILFGDREPRAAL